MKRNIKAVESENGVVIEMDYTYFNSLKYAISKAFKYGYCTEIDDDEFMDLIEIEDELSKIKGSWNE